MEGAWRRVEEVIGCVGGERDQTYVATGPLSQDMLSVVRWTCTYMDVYNMHIHVHVHTWHYMYMHELTYMYIQLYMYM